MVQEDDLAREFGPARGKGDAMWRALGALESDIVAFADTDTEDFHEHFLTGLLGPLICRARGGAFGQGRIFNARFPQTARCWPTVGGA